MGLDGTSPKSTSVRDCESTLMIRSHLTVNCWRGSIFLRKSVASIVMLQIIRGAVYRIVLWPVPSHVRFLSIHTPTDYYNFDKCPSNILLIIEIKVSVCCSVMYYNLMVKNKEASLSFSAWSSSTGRAPLSSVCMLMTGLWSCSLSIACGAAGLLPGFGPRRSVICLSHSTTTQIHFSG